MNKTKLKCKPLSISFKYLLSMTEHDIYGLLYMTKWFAFQFGFIQIMLYVCFRIIYVCLTNYALCMF